MWIPDNASDLQLRLLIISHCGASGHRGTAATFEALSSRFWNNMRDDAALFLKQCLHCLPARGGDIIPRPFGASVQLKFRNEIIDFDYLYLEPARDGTAYLLVVRDRLSGFCDLFPTTSPTARHTAESLLDWFSRFGIAPFWVSDRGTHFLNQTIAELCFLLGAQHQFHLAHCPWTHGVVENLNRQILSVFRSVCSEFRIEFKDWPFCISLVRFALNNSISPNSKHAPIELMTGLPPSSSLDTVWHPLKSQFSTVPLTQLQLDNMISDLKQSLAAMHRHTLDVRDAAHLRANRRRRTPLANFAVGDFVLYSSHLPKSKLSFKWHGPARVADCRSEHIYLIENLITHEQFECHAQRLRFYCDSSLNVTQSLLDQIAFDDTGYEVQAILDAKKDKRIWKLLVRWRGLTAEYDSWETLASLKRDIPVYLKQLLKASTLPAAPELLGLLSREREM